MKLNHYKQILLDYLEDGKVRQPTDLDRDVVGSSPSFYSLMFGTSNDNNFGHALKELMDEGKVKAWCDDDGWKYQKSLSLELSESQVKESEK